MALAIESFCRSPPDSRTPRSPISVSNPRARSLTNPIAPEKRIASSSSEGVAFGLLKRTLFLIVSEKRNEF